MSGSDGQGKFKIVLSDYDKSGLLAFSFYAVGSDPYNRIAIRVVDENEHGGPLATLTVNFPDAPPDPGCVWIKTWSENAGVYENLLNSGYIEFTGRVRTVRPDVMAFEVRLRDDVLAAARAEIDTLRVLGGDTDYTLDSARSV